MTDDTPLVEQLDSRVALLTLNRPKSKNALDQALVQKLGDALERLAGDRQVLVVVLAGSGGSFCSGVDLREAAQDIKKPEVVAARIDGFHHIIRAITQSPKPVIAAVNGGAVGFGCDLALACDLRLIGEQGYLQEKFVSLGLMPDGGGTFLLPRLVGLSKALELLLLGSRVDAAQAVSLGLAHRVVPDDELLTETLKLAKELAKGPPLAYAAIKHATRAGLAGDLETALEREKTGQLRLLQSADVTEAVLAFLQKRQAKFKGK